MPDTIERRECPECGSGRGTVHGPLCPVQANGMVWLHQCVTVRYVRERPTVDSVVDPLEPVARCLSKYDHGFISGTDWAGDLGDRYRGRARAVLQTIRNCNGGMLSGGLPPTPTVARGVIDD